jgi:hypothetical protein
MADLSKLKQRKSSLPPPPAIDEASLNLEAPEHAPAAPAPTASSKPRVDGRTLRRTNRTIQLATRVTAEFDERLRVIAQRDGLLIVEVLERALDAYEASR